MEELKKLLTDQKTAFEEFKAANDERIKQIETKGHADPLLESKVTKANETITALETKITELETKMNRPGAGAQGAGQAAEVKEHSDAFTKFLEKGQDTGLTELEQKALNVTTDADGGYAVPEKLDTNIIDILKDSSPMRGLCNVIKVGSAEYKKLVNLHGAASGWVGETDERPETNGPKLAQITPFMGEIYANPAATQTMLDDVFFNAQSWLATEVALEFSEQEGTAFTSGDGVKKPKGFLAYTSVATADKAGRAFGQLEHILAAGVAALTGDELIDLVYALKKALRSGAKWMMNGATVQNTRKLKDSEGNYLWAPGMQDGEPSKLMGYGIEENEDMPDLGASNVPVAFGNWKRGYTIVDRMGTRTLRDPYTNKPFVHFYTTKRVGGMVADSNAIKLLKNKAA